jgi:predicted outer membrane repeat protein
MVSGSSSSRHHYTQVAEKGQKSWREFPPDRALAAKAYFMKTRLAFLGSIFTLPLLLLAFTSGAQAANQTVSNLGDSGLSSQLRQKITACQSGTNPGGTITFSVAGIVKLDPANGALPDITTNVTINGGGTVEISGSDGTRILNVSAGGTLTLSNITISHAWWGNGDGGAVANFDSTLNVNKSRFLYNATGANGSGSAIWSSGALNITDSEFGYNTGGGGAVKPLSSGGVTMITGSNFHDNQSTASGGGGYGGAMQVFDGPSVTISNSTFINNKAGVDGGAIYVTGNSTLTVKDNSTLTSNSALSGRGGAIANSGNLTLANITVSGNSAYRAGGGIINLGTADLTNVTVNANASTQDAAGGIENRGTISLTSVTLSSNLAEFYSGGGMTNFGTATLTNVTISGNSAPRSGGGGIYNDSHLTLTNVTLSGNSASANLGGGIYNENGATIQVTNTIVEKSSGGNCGLHGSWQSANNLSDDGTCYFTPNASGALQHDNVTDLILGPLANNGGPTQTHMPQAGSRAIDNGTGGFGAPPTDQRGTKRPQGPQYDVGAVEVVQPLVENGHPYVQYDGWRGFNNASANGGYYRMSNISNDAVTYKFTSTSIRWITRKGPNMGKALVTIDGVSKGTFDLYSSSALWNQQIVFGNLTNAAHTIVIKVTGTKNASATDYNVALDGYLVGSATKPGQESALAIQYNNWVGKSQSAASGSSYRSNGDLGASSLFRFSGTSIFFITALGPSYGYVNVLIDGVLKSSNLDLYSPTQQWKHGLYYSGLANANHTIEVRPAHIKNASSSGYGVVVDAFTGPFTALP